LRAKGLQADGGKEIFGEKLSSILQLIHALKRRSKRMITYLLKTDGTTLTTHREIRNHVTVFYASANAG